MNSTRTTSAADRTAHSQKTSKKASDAACCWRRSSSACDRQLLRPGRVAGPLQEEVAGLLQKRLDVGVQRAQPLAQAGQVELLAPLLDGRGHRGADAAPLGAEQAEQSDRRPAQMQRECTCRRPR